jgi:predicted RNA binding protein YcfA (HicA-like mRNA interferase family)
MTSSRDLCKEVACLGWELARIQGSHHIYKHPRLPGRLVIPHPKKDLPRGLVRDLQKKARGQ